jgi:hypothetical protein
MRVPHHRVSVIPSMVIWRQYRATSVKVHNAERDALRIGDPGDAEAGDARGDHRYFPQAVADLCDALGTEFAPGFGGRFGPVDVGGVPGGHGAGAYDEDEVFVRCGTE